MNIKKIMITLAFVLSLFSVSAYAKTMQFTMGDTTAKVDEGAIVAHTMEVAPYTVEGRTMVPVRIIAETFNADVQHIPEEVKVVITLGDKTISLVIGESTATVNGEVVALDVPSVETNGRTLVPLRFVSENLGFDVDYLASTEQILITNDPAVFKIGDTKISLADFKAMYKINSTRYGEFSSETEVIDLTKALLYQFAIYESEEAKWEITLDPALYDDVKADAEGFASIEGVLDASWISLLEKDYRSMYLAQFLGMIYTPDEAEAEKYYNDNFYAAKHILFTDKATADKVLKKIRNGSDFDTLMKEYSEDPGLASYPDGYVFVTGQFVPEFENTVKELKVNKVSNVVKSDSGYHIIKRLALPEFDELRAEHASAAYADEKVSEHLNLVADSGEIKDDTYTVEQLLELCK